MSMSLLLIAWQVFWSSCTSSPSDFTASYSDCDVPAYMVAVDIGVAACCRKEAVVDDEDVDAL